MNDKQFYSVGEVGEICNISRKALRFYDEIGVIRPDKVCDNNYRYYSRETLLTIPVIKYYKQMGFKLSEMREFIYGNTYNVMKRLFEQKIEALQVEEQERFIKFVSVKDWHSLIAEAEAVIEANVNNVSVKFVEPAVYCYMDQEFNSSDMESIINIDFTNHIEKIGNAITGPVVINFPSINQRIEHGNQPIKVMQKTIKPCEPNQVVQFGGAMMITCYHIGSHETIANTYIKMQKWAEKYGYKFSDGCFERYVTDYWTTRNKDLFVTEIMIGILK